MYYDKLIIFFLFLSGVFIIIFGSSLDRISSQIVMVIGFLTCLFSIGAGLLVATNGNDNILSPEAVDPHDIDEITLCEF